MIKLYADGSSIKIPKIAWGSGVWNSNTNEIIVVVGGLNNTNIFAELIAVRESLKWIIKNYNEDKHFEIITDSQYTVNCMILWRKLWQNHNIINQSNGVNLKDSKKCISHWLLINEMWKLLDNLRTNGIIVNFKHVRGHGKDKNMNQEDINGNAEADKIATKASHDVAIGLLKEYNLGYNSQSNAKLLLLKENI
jgi:ribonuclease HI